MQGSRSQINFQLGTISISFNRIVIEGVNTSGVYGMVAKSDFQGLAIRVFNVTEKGIETTSSMSLFLGSTFLAEYK